MKRFIIFLAFIGLLNAADSDISKVLKERTGLDFKIISSRDFKSNIVIAESPTGERFVLLSSSDGSYIVPINDGIALNDSKNELKSTIQSVGVYNKNLKDTRILKVFKQQEKNVLKIPAKNPTSKTIYMVLDTTCPYCLKEIDKLDSYLQEGNLEVLMVAFLGPKAQKRTAGFYEELPKAQSRDDKIKLLKKVFTKDYAPSSGNDNVTKQMTESTIAAGIDGVPYIVVK